MSVTGGSPRQRRGLVLALMVLSLLVVVLDNSILNIALRTLADPQAGLGATQGQLEWAINAYTLVFAALLFAWSFAGGRWGVRRCLMIGLAVFGAGSLGSAFAGDMTQLIAARAVMGVGAAAVQPLSLALVTTTFPEPQRAKAIGAWSAAAGLALAVGPLLGGILLTHFWWGSIFLINVPIVALVLVGTLLVVPPSPGGATVRLDLLGLVLSGAGLVALTFGIIRGGELGGWASPQAWGPVLAGVLLLAGFAWSQLRSPAPVFDVRLLRDRRVAGASIAVATGFFGLLGVIFALLFFLQSVRGFSPLEAAACAMPVALGQLLVSPRAATLARRLGYRRVAGAGLVGTALVMAGYGWVDVGTPIWALALLLFGHGVTLSLVFPPMTELMMGAAPPQRAGMMSAANTAIRQVGTALGVAVLGTVLALRYRGVLDDRLPVPLPAAARDSIEATSAAAARIAARLGDADAATSAALVRRAAEQAFLSGLRWTSWTAAACTLLGAVLVVAWLPSGRVAQAVPTPEASPAEKVVSES